MAVLEWNTWTVGGKVWETFAIRVTGSRNPEDQLSTGLSLMENRRWLHQQYQMMLRVKEGYFTVFAVKGMKTQRYVVELYNLSNPAILSLLELAREEYGFQQKGALCLPCGPRELQDILRIGN
ncbi:putative SAUR-like auxin-responsive protein family [Hibiscus syriacus]|uniref:SAUR-like auxin-responsive protein family n=1 Tax=Hibiscus syriacus TaxID=106335 RepID=A0A6A3CKQ7_HIBSY|nr:putative SAUR-like auxin-responsive protein family [Hibiscus syriacus]